VLPADPQATAPAGTPAGSEVALGLGLGDPLADGEALAAPVVLTTDPVGDAAAPAERVGVRVPGSSTRTNAQAATATAMTTRMPLRSMSHGGTPERCCARLAPLYAAARRVGTGGSAVTGGGVVTGGPAGGAEGRCAARERRDGAEAATTGTTSVGGADDHAGSGATASGADDDTGSGATASGTGPSEKISSEREASSS